MFSVRARSYTLDRQHWREKLFEDEGKPREGGAGHRTFLPMLKRCIIISLSNIFTRFVQDPIGKDHKNFKRNDQLAPSSTKSLLQVDISGLSTGIQVVSGFISKLSNH